MYLWLKLLAFSLALLGPEVFVTGQGTPGDGANLTTPAPSTLGFASNTTTSTEIATPQTKPSCDEKFGNVTVSYIYDNSSKNFNAFLKGDKNPKCEYADCEKELKNLPECSQKTVTLSNGSCTPDKIINLDVPPGIHNFELKNCTPDIEANTSICLEWKVKNNFTCDTQKISYNFHCIPEMKPSPSKPERLWLQNLRVRTNYTCAAEVLYNNVILLKQDRRVQTDFGTPEMLPLVQCKNSTNSTTLVSWAEPASKPHGYILCYKKTPSGNVVKCNSQ